MSIAGTSRSPCSRATHTFEWDAKRRVLDEIAARRWRRRQKRKRRPNSGRSRRKPSQQWSSDFPGRVWANAKTTLCARYTAIGDTEWPRRA